MRKKRYVVFAIAILVAMSVAFAGHSIAAKKQFFAIATGGTGGPIILWAVSWPRP